MNATRHSEPESYRVEHHSLGSASRVLLHTTIRSSAHASAKQWRRVLERSGANGAVVIFDSRNGSIILESPLAQP